MVRAGATTVCKTKLLLVFEPERQLNTTEDAERFLKEVRQKFKRSKRGAQPVRRAGFILRFRSIRPAAGAAQVITAFLQRAKRHNVQFCVVGMQLPPDLIDYQTEKFETALRHFYRED